MLSVGSNQTSDSNLRPMVAKLMQDEKIFAGITVEKESPNLPGTYATHALVLRYLQNGTLDPAFSDDGVLDISIMYSPTYPSYFGTFAELSQGETLIL